jgi:hypothetical protein
MLTPAELIVPWLKRALRMHNLANLQIDRLGHFLSGLSLGLLSPEQKSELTVYLYNARGEYQVRDLFDWEEPWFAQDLPPSGKILFGGAGSGREVGHLLTRGYSIYAFDPASAYVKKARREYPNPALLGYSCLSYEQLALQQNGRAVLDDLHKHAPYDAVVLGWGSLTHVPSANLRTVLFRVLQTLCPTGPLLFSFWMGSQDTQPVRPKTWQLGFRLAQRLTGKQLDPRDCALDDVLSRCGFGHSFTLPEIHLLAEETHYQIKRLPTGASDTYPHATFVPRGGAD